MSTYSATHTYTYPPHLLPTVYCKQLSRPPSNTSLCRLPLGSSISTFTVRPSPSGHSNLLLIPKYVSLHYRRINKACASIPRHFLRSYPHRVLVDVFHSLHQLYICCAWSCPARSRFLLSRRRPPIRLAVWTWHGDCCTHLHGVGNSIRGAVGGIYGCVGLVEVV